MFYFKKKYSNLFIMKRSFFNKKPFFVGDISANHCGNFNHAKKLIVEAKKNANLQRFEATVSTNKKASEKNKKNLIP